MKLVAEKDIATFFENIGERWAEKSRKEFAKKHNADTDYLPERLIKNCKVDVLQRKAWEKANV